MTRRVLAFLTLLAGSLSAQVTLDRLLHPEREPQNWLTYSGGYSAQRYSTLDQITHDNAKNLEQQWVFQARSLEKFEATPLVVDGIMYLTEPPNNVVALDAKTGAIFWVYEYRPSPDARPCCGAVNRGVAILGDTLFMGTIDAHLIALDAKSGHPMWNTLVGDPKLGYSITHAPLVVKNKVIVGLAGAEYGIRGFIAAYDAATGKEAWRFNTIPGPGEPGHETWTGDTWQHGGGSAWITGSFDPALNMVYWGVGNPGADWNGDNRAGDNLYSDCAVALDADTGKLKWYFQFTPHDEYDYDAVQIPVLVDANWKGSPRKMMMWANRNGFFYVLDRTNGKFLYGMPFTKQTWAKGLDEKGRPIRAANQSPTPEGTVVYPGVQGGTNWFSTAYNPSTRLYYFQALERCNVFSKRSMEWEPLKSYMGGTARPAPGESFEKSLRAINIQTGEIAWDVPQVSGALTASAGVLGTAGGLVFFGENSGAFMAVDAASGKPLWQFPTNQVWKASPMTYVFDNKQYVAIAVGHDIVAFALPD